MKKTLNKKTKTKLHAVVVLVDWICGTLSSTGDDVIKKWILKSKCRIYYKDFFKTDTILKH